MRPLPVRPLGGLGGAKQMRKNALRGAAEWSFLEGIAPLRADAAEGARGMRQRGNAEVNMPVLMHRPVV